MTKRKIILPLLLTLTMLSSCNGGGTSEVISSSVQASSISVESSVSSENPSSESSSQEEVAKDIYCAPNGKGTDGEGTKENPYEVGYAMTILKPGKTLYLMAGTYSYSYTLAINHTNELYPSNSIEEMKMMEPAKKADGTYEEVVFDFSAMPFYSSNRGISLDSNYWHIKGFKVMGAGDNGVYIGGNYNTVEGIDVSECRDTGIQLGRSASNLNEIALWPSYNTILNCTSHDNHDPSGEDSDGFACKLTTGVGNVFDGCIAYNNVDDGWDLYTKGESGPIGPVTLRNCVAFNNGITSNGVGTSNSDGNGFKLGGETIAVPHKVYNCVAFNNLATGFTDNSNPGTIYFEKCTAFNNGTRDDDGYNFSTCRDRETSINFYKDCLSYCNGDRTDPILGETRIANSKDEYKGTAQNCAFYCGLSNLYINELQETDYYVDGLKGTLFEADNPFVSITTPQVQASKNVPASVKTDIHKVLRNADGSVNLGDFLKLKDNSPFATMGSNGSKLGAELSK